MRCVSRLPIGLALLIGLSTLPACDKSVGPGGSSDAVVEIAGCKSVGLDKAGISNDSCFSYSFHDILVADFCVSANCCPDSNRFSIMHTISNDTIAVTIADTAARLCRCICTHRVHAEFSSLVGDRLLFLVFLKDSSTTGLLYSIHVQRI